MSMPASPPNTAGDDPISVAPAVRLVARRGAAERVVVRRARGALAVMSYPLLDALSDTFGTIRGGGSFGSSSSGDPHQQPSATARLEGTTEGCST